MTSIAAAARRALVGRHLREIHFYFGSARPLDVALALVSYLRAGEDDAVRRFEEAMVAHCRLPDAIAFGAGRMALYAILAGLGVGAGDEVIVPAFTCVVVPNAIRYRGARPIYVDIDRDTWNIDPERAERAIGVRTKAILIQHTFGVPANVEAIRRIASTRGVAVIEDCAHLIGIDVAGHPVGTIGDAAFFSFESTKPLTLGRGGVAVAIDPALRDRIRAVQKALPLTSRTDGIRAGVRLLVLVLLHRPSVFRFGRFVAALLFKTGVFHANISDLERWGRRPSRYPARLTGYQAVLGLRQLRKLEGTNDHRQRLTRLYDREIADLGLKLQQRPSRDLPLLRYSFRMLDVGEAVERCADEQVELGRWFHSPVVPVRLTDPELAASGYVKGSCPVAEEIAGTCANLPTDPIVTEADAKRAVAVLRAVVARPSSRRDGSHRAAERA